MDVGIKRFCAFLGGNLRTGEDNFFDLSCPVEFFPDNRYRANGSLRNDFLLHVKTLVGNRRMSPEFYPFIRERGRDVDTFFLGCV